MPNSNIYAAAHFGLELDNKHEVSLIRSIEGGGVRADVMTYQPALANEYARFRMIGKPKYEDIKIQVGMAMSKPLYEWMQEFFRGVPSRKSGAIVAADFSYKERARREFKDAMIKELTFPKLDGSDKNPVYINVAIAPEQIEFQKGSGNSLPPQAAGFRDQKQWTANNFSFSLDGYEAACKRVTKVDSFTIKQNIIEHHVGGQKWPIKMPSAVEFPSITFYVPEVDAQPFMDRIMKRVGTGKDAIAETLINGEINAYDNENHSIFSVELQNVDIVSVSPDRSDASSEEIKLVKVELFCEKMDFDYPVLELE